MARAVALPFLLLLTVVPLAVAWGDRGSYEPDTKRDVTDGWMFKDPDTNPTWGVNKVYFNGIIAPYSSPLNPNVAVAQTRVLTPGLQMATAVLGVWKDCNKDGYIGFGDQAFFEYRSELLLDTSVCRRASTPDPIPVGWMPVHNDGQWVRELLWIGSGQNAANPDGVATRMLDDGSAHVWADAGKPEDDASPLCAVNPPTGTFSSTGGMIAYADCHGNNDIVKNYNSAVATADPSNNYRLTFDDQETPQCSSSQANLWIGVFQDSPECPRGTGLLEDQSGNPSVQVIDCAHGTPIYDSTGAQILFVPNPSVPKILNTRGSYWDSVMLTNTALHGGCTGEDGQITSLYETVDPERPVSAMNAKRDATFWFEFSNDRVRSVTGRLTPDDATPANAGITALDQAGPFKDGPIWASQDAASPPLILRDDLGLQPSAYYTFYAFVGPTAVSQYGLSLPRGSAVGTYGLDACGGSTNTVVRGWDCNRDHWWNAAYGASAMPYSTWSQQPIGATLGDPYNLRDIDCFDQSTIADSANIVWGNAACQRP